MIGGPFSVRVLGGSYLDFAFLRGRDRPARQGGTGANAQKVHSNTAPFSHFENFSLWCGHD